MREMISLSFYMVFKWIYKEYFLNFPKTPVHLAVETGQIEILRTFLKLPNVDLSKKDKITSNTKCLIKKTYMEYNIIIYKRPIDIAMEKNNQEIVQLLSNVFSDESGH